MKRGEWKALLATRFTFRADLRLLSPAVGPAFASRIGTVTNKRKKKDGERQKDAVP